jgi:hypothetical protein
LRWLLKAAGRSYGLKAISVTKEAESSDGGER